jgi:hypothetical protein
MTMATHSALESDPFQLARNHFEAVVEWLGGSDAPVDHSLLEEGLDERGREVLRLLYQARLDELSRAARSAAARTAAPTDTSVRERSRQVETLFGPVRWVRLGYKVAGQPTRFPLDEPLNLPAEVYSHPVRRRVAEQARVGAFDRVVEHVDSVTGAHVPKRQAEQLAREAARDVDAFYAQRPANDMLAAGALLLASADSKGVRMVPKALREATRKAAEADQAAAVRGDPMAKKKPRLHDKRMAIVTAVWEQEPSRAPPTTSSPSWAGRPGASRHASLRCPDRRTSASRRACRRASRRGSARCSTSSITVTPNARAAPLCWSTATSISRPPSWTRGDAGSGS